MRALFFIVCIVSAVACGDSTPAESTPLNPTPGAWTHDNRLAFDGRARTYSLYMPTNGESRGLMVVLHGSGQTVDNMISQVAPEATAERNGLIVAVPAGVDDGWNDEDPPGGALANDVGFIDALVTQIRTAYPSLPANKVFAHGFSNGGGLATRLACEASQVRGIGVVGNYYVSLSAACERARGYSIPGWFGAGVDDTLVRVESVRATMSNYATDLTTCSGSGSLELVQVEGLTSDVACKQVSGCGLARLCEYTGRGHEVLPGSFEAAWQFLSAAVETSTN